MSSPSSDQPLVSVVTPVYNGEPYLRECVESVLAQTYDNWEYLIVDNRSTDGTREIAREYELRDGRVKLHTYDEFVTMFENSNRALRLISRASVYCKVLHADDWLLRNCLERMVARAEAHPSVGIVGAYRLEDQRVSLDGLPYSVRVIPGRDLARSALLGRPYPYLFGSPTSLLLRSDLVRARQDFYNVENPFQGDQEACLELLRESDFGFVHQVLTYTRRHDEAGYSFFAAVGAEVPGKIDLLIKFGGVYLRKREYEDRLAVLAALYAGYLARNISKLRNARFRAYQRAALARMLPALVAGGVPRGLLRRLTGALGARRTSPASIT